MQGSASVLLVAQRLLTICGGFDIFRIAVHSAIAHPDKRCRGKMVESRHTTAGFRVAYGATQHAASEIVLDVDSVMLTPEKEFGVKW